MRRNSILKVVLLGAGVLFAGKVVSAQDPQGGEAPKPPAKAYGPIGVDQQDQDQNSSPNTLQPDNRPLTGFQEPTVGSPIERHSYWVPGLSYYNFVNSNATFQGGGDNWSSTNYFSGNVTLMENWARSQLAVNYSGGGYVSTDSAADNGWFSQLGASQTFTWERLQLTFLDQFEYLPQSQFGFGAGTGLSVPGTGGSLGGGSVGGSFGGGVTGLGPGFTPGQSIFTATGARYFNTGGIQMTYQLSRRSSITLGGLASFLRFVDPGNIESDSYIGSAGYNYQITRNNTIGVQYRYTSYHYINDPQAIGDQVIQVAYSRKITGRLALQLAGGPEITHFRIPQGTGTQTQYVSGSGSASLTYAFPRTHLSAGYFHGTTAGSGVFFGATTDQVTGSISHRLTRLWTGDVHVGYARNHSVQTSAGSYNNVFAGASLARPLGRNASVSLGYNAYDQNYYASSSTLIHQISFGISWHTRPFVLR
jgi:hypothetical protein